MTIGLIDLFMLLFADLIDYKLSIQSFKYS